MRSLLHLRSLLSLLAQILNVKGIYNSVLNLRFEQYYICIEKRIFTCKYELDSLRLRYSP